MHNLIRAVFKVIAFCIISMILLDTGRMVVDRVMLESRMQNAVLLISREITRNNCIPNTLAEQETFEKKLDYIVEHSNIALDWEANFTYDLEDAESLSEDNAKDYGESVTLLIKIHMRPFKLILHDKADETGALVTKQFFDYTLTYREEIECLRYLR